MIDNKFRSTYTTTYNSNDDPDDKYTCFECDELIAPIILELNRKGYKTKYCCSGHIYERTVDFEDDRNMNMEKEIFRFDDEPNYSHPYILFDSFIKTIPNLDKLPNGWKALYTPVNISEQIKLYKKIGETEVDKPLNCKYRIILRYDFTEKLVFSKFFDHIGENKFKPKYYTTFKFICKIMEDLYKWINELPYNN